jgi:hypothetical protein
MNQFDMCIYKLSYVCNTFEKWDYWMMAFKNDKPQFQSFTGLAAIRSFVSQLPC